MLTHPTYGRLVTPGLTGMAKALDEQQRQPDITMSAFEERLALLVDREATESSAPPASARVGLPARRP
jgi:hypothetical protein